MELWGAREVAHTSNILCVHANINKLLLKKILERAKSCTRIYAKKLTLDLLTKKIHFFENWNVNIFSARTRKFSKITICDISIIKFVIFKNFGLSVSKNR